MRFIKQQDGTYLDTLSKDNHRLTEEQFLNLIKSHEDSLVYLSDEIKESIGESPKRKKSPREKVSDFVNDLKSSLGN